MNYLVYPNPTTGKITVKCVETLRATSLHWTDATNKNKICTVKKNILPLHF